MSYPVRFHRIAVPKPWAGSRLRALLPDIADELPPGTGESIELADMPGQVSVVANGAWRKQSIHHLMRDRRGQLLGDLAARHDLPDFPLAVKLLDTAQPLSIQDHPDDKRENGRMVSRGKSECWIVLDADSEAVIYQGLKPGVTREMFEDALTDGHPIELLNARQVKPGDYLYNNAGMIHAIGAGLALLEIQQNCPVTYRLWDFPRDLPREMHIAPGLSAAKFDLLLPEIQMSDTEDALLQADGPFGVRSLRVKMARRLGKEWSGFTLVTCLGGACEITGVARDNLQPAALKPGDTVMYTSEFDQFEIYPDREAWVILSWARE
ncbi:MAG: class I mannose-6-phosphate isomerase [Planctomycetes bacterium]|nr:class I mannose-6-phosphate isomerase [Planctomycetota bacterium]